MLMKVRQRKNLFFYPFTGFFDSVIRYCQNAFFSSIFQHSITSNQIAGSDCKN